MFLIDIFLITKNMYLVITSFEGEDKLSIFCCFLFLIDLWCEMIGYWRATITGAQVAINKILSVNNRSIKCYYYFTSTTFK